MISILIAAAIGLLVSILLTPYLIRVFSRQGFGQEIREEGPQSHQGKRGTPTMGGVAILAAIWIGYLASHLAADVSISASGPSSAITPRTAVRCPPSPGAMAARVVSAARIDSGFAL